MNVWVDIDNPPQARYLLPIARRFEEEGSDVVVTARDYGDTLAILEREGVAFTAIGASFGKGLRRKIIGLAARARNLRGFARGQRVPFDLVLSGSRSATLAARMLRIPSFAIVDYEYVDLSIFRLAGTFVIHPKIIDSSSFSRIPSRRLLPFDGLKEDITFSDVDVESVPAHEFGGDDGTARLLFRPPAEESHYFRGESRDLALELLTYLSSREVQVVFSPRFEWQVRYLELVGSWEHEPIVLREPIGTVPLLKGVDGVVSAGGTMLREAAYLGIPAYSIFRSRIGAVDRYLASVGRLVMLSSSDDFSQIRIQPRSPAEPLRTTSNVVERIEEIIGERVECRAGEIQRQEA